MHSTRDRVKKDQLDTLQSHEPELFPAAVVLWGGCHVPQETKECFHLVQGAQQAALDSLVSSLRGINIFSTPLTAWEMNW